MTNVAVSIDESRLTMIWRHGGAINIVETALGPDATSSLRELLNKAPAAERATFTLFRPIVHTTVVQLPRMSADNIQRVLTRDATRYVAAPGDGQPPAVATRWINNNRYVAVFAPDTLLATIERVAADHGWKALEIRSCDDAMAFGARAGSGEQADPFCVVCDQAGPTHIVHVRAGVPVLGRTFLAGADAARVREFIDLAMPDRGSGQPPSVTILGGATGAARLAEALGKEGHRTRVVASGLPANASSPSIIAWAGEGAGARFPLRSRLAQQQRLQQLRRITVALSAAAVVAAIAGVSLAQRSVAQRLAAVERQRADMSAPVSNALAERARIDHLASMVAALAAHERSTSNITNVLTGLSLALPQGTSLTMFQVAGDTITIEGESNHSADVYEALRRMPLLLNLKPAAPLRRERGPGDTMIEKFAYSARLRPPASAPPQ